MYSEMVTKKIDFHSGSLEKQRVLKIVATVMVAINIDGITINRVSGAPLCETNKISKLSDKLGSTLV